MAVVQSTGQSAENRSVRIGIGTDRHRLEAGNQLVLAGVTIPAKVCAIAHSDGDAILHAISDAILGATGGDDIGTLFPDDDARWKDVDSREIVSEAIRFAREKGWQPCQVDVVVHLERPRLKEHRPAMRESLSTLLEIPGECIGLKAKTGEGLGPVGEGLAIDTFAVVQLERAGDR